jgi:hypothetical protein
MDIISRKEAKLKNLKRYYTGKSCPNGHIAERWVSTMSCCECTSSRAKEWREDNVAHRREYRNKYRNENVEQERKSRRDYYERHKQRLTEKHKRDYRENPERYILARTKDRAKKKGIDFNLTIDDIIVPKQCPVFKVDLRVGDLDWCPSIDRIDPTKGYTKGNIQIISMKANRMKNDATATEIKQLYEFMCSLS